MEVMDPVAVMEVTPVPDTPFMVATPPQPPLVAALSLRRSARCLNRPPQPSYAEQEVPKESSGRRRGPKRKRDEEKQEPAAQDAVRPGRKAAKVEPWERKPMPVIAAEPISCAGFAGAAADDDLPGTGKSAKLRVKKILRSFNSYYLHLVQEEQKRAQAALQEGKGGLKRQSKGSKNKKGGKKHTEGEKKEKRPSNRSVNYKGIDVGNQFYSSAEMVVLGIQGHWLNGIEYMGMKYQGKKEYENLTSPLATCIVMSGIYEL